MRNVFLHIFLVLTVAVTAGCGAGIPQRSSEVGNPAPSEDIITTPYAHQEIDPDIAIEFDARLTLVAFGDGTFALTENGMHIAGFAVALLDDITAATIADCPEDAVDWNGFETCWIDGQLYAADPTKLVVFDFEDDETVERVRLVSLLKNMHAVKPDTSNMSTSPEPDPDAPQPTTRPLEFEPQTIARNLGGGEGPEFEFSSIPRTEIGVTTPALSKIVVTP